MLVIEGLSGRNWYATFLKYQVISTWCIKGIVSTFFFVAHSKSFNFENNINQLKLTMPFIKKRLGHKLNFI